MAQAYARRPRASCGRARPRPYTLSSARRSLICSRHGEVAGELGVAAVRAGQERARWEQALARVALGARRQIAMRLAGQRAGEHVARVEHEKAHERLERVAVRAL